MGRKQIAYDAASGAAVVVAVWGYHVVLGRFLAALDRPLVFEVGFLMSLGAALLYELKGDFRRAVAGCVATGTVFVAGALAAMWFRDLYLQLVADVRGAPELADVFGQDVFAALTNRAVGYGGSFALGLLAARLALGGRARSWLMKVILGPASASAVCQCCGQTMPSSAQP